MAVDPHTAGAVAHAAITTNWSPAVVAAFIAAAVALVSSIVSAVASWRSNHNARQQLKRQLNHDATQRDRDRAMAMRRDVYIPGVEAIVGCQSLLGQLANPDTDLISVQRALQENLATIAKVQVVGSEETISAVMAYLAVFMGAYFDLLLANPQATGRKRQIQEVTALRESSRAEIGEFVELMKQYNLSGTKDADYWERIKMQLEIAQRTRQGHEDSLVGMARANAVAQIEQLEAFPQITAQLSGKLADAVIAARRDIELPIDPATLRRLYDEQQQVVTQKMKQMAANLRSMVQPKE